MDRIAIIGSGSVGLSLGLGLKDIDLRETEVVGTSGDRKWRGKAAEIGAFDSVSGNLRDALDGARLVILDTPPAETRELMEAIGPVLEQDGRVTSTGLSMVQALQWADSFFRPDITFVAGRPLLRTAADDLDAADGTVFHGVDYCLASSATARAEGVKTIVGLVEALGANPLFIDPHEHDSYAAALTLTPLLFSSALMSAVSDSPSCREMSKLAGDEFREMSKLACADPIELAAEIQANPEPVARWISRMIETLISYRSVVQGPRDRVEDVLIQAWEERAKLEMGEAEEEDGRPRTPSAGQTVAGMFVGSRLAGRMRDINEANKNAPWRYPRKRTGADR